LNILKSIRVRLTLWYLLVFGSLLIAFSAYIYSHLRDDLQRRFDLSLLRTAQTMATYFSEFVERKNVEPGAVETVHEFQFGELRPAILRGSRVLAASGPEILHAIAATGVLQSLGAQPAFATDARAGVRVVALALQVDGIDYSLVMMEPTRDLRDQLRRMRQLFFVGFPAALLLTALGGLLLARKALDPVVKISRQAESIGAENLHERLSIANPNDEIGQLAGVINALLSRLDTAFRVMREFVADASHELRTPVAIIHGEADVALAKDRNNGDYRQSLAVIHNQSHRMGRIVNDMLALARADAGQQSLRLEEMYLDDLVHECCRAAQTLAGPAGVGFRFETDEDIAFRGDEELLKRMALNLLDNAIHYTPEGGSVSVKLTADGEWARLMISDTGIGIPPECQARVFDRFYRVEAARKSGDGGSGLGLSIVKLAAESHRGRVTLSSEPGRGSTFTVTLPLH
jgi:heavy metal sensor kinase